MRRAWISSVTRLGWALSWSANSSRAKHTSTSSLAAACLQASGDNPMKNGSRSCELRGSQSSQYIPEAPWFWHRGSQWW